MKTGRVKRWISTSDGERFVSPAGSLAFSKMAVAIFSPLALRVSLFLARIYIHILYFALSYRFSRSFFLSHILARTHLSSVFVRIKSLAYAKHTRAHVRHFSKSILYVSRLYEGTPSSFSTLTVTSFSPSPAPPAACCSVARWSPPSHVTEELKTEKLLT